MTFAYDTLLAAMTRAIPGETFTVDNWRDEADMAQLTSAERGAAHDHAVEDGYLVPLGGRVGDTFCTYTVPTTHPAGKSRRVCLYARTSKALPGQAAHERHREPSQVPGQVDLLDLVGVQT